MKEQLCNCTVVVAEHLYRMSGGELFEYISEKEQLSEEEAARFVKQLLLGVEHFHDKGIIHLDLKANDQNQFSAN